MKIKPLFFCKIYFWLISLSLFFSCSNRQELLVNYSNPEIVYSGRIDSSLVNGTKLYWSGSSIKLNFQGESISALMSDNKGDNYYNVIIDDDDLSIFRPDTTKQYHQLASKLSKRKHTIEIFKRTEWDKGSTSFYGFKIQGNPKVLPKPLPKKRKIEFYGNSITTGYAVEDTSGSDSPDSIYTNNYASYAAKTARYFDADYRCICKSGIGMTISWFPSIMPEMYNRLDPSDENSEWNFLLYTPDIVVINIFQNDSWLFNRKDFNEFKVRFGTEIPQGDYFINAYQEFVENIRRHYPKAKIICMLGNMDATTPESKWVDYIKTAVSNVNDQEVYTHFVPFKGTNGHPSIKEQNEIAKSLIGFIEDHIDW